jgi:hypothetical protein
MGYLINKFFVSKPGTTGGLKQRLREEIAAIAEQTTRRVMESLRGILEECSRNGGRHLNDVLFKT